MSLRDEFRFRRFDTVGRPDAEEDQEFLDQAFVDTGALAALRDCSNPARLVLGRTGTGKTAILSRLETSEERVIRIRPESLALSYISNSTIIEFLHHLGVKLDIFFRLLWRHVFSVEIIRTHFNINTQEAKRTVFEQIKSLFRNNRHAQALRYLEEWGQSFWEETDYRIKETTTKLETQVKEDVTAKFPNVSFGLHGAQGLTEEQKVDVTQRAQRIVNSVQIRELSDVIDLLAEVLDDPKQRYYIVIDRLDEDWIEDRLRYLLIRALIETARDFSRVRNAKIVIALRQDLLDRVYRLTRDPGFQEEKYESLYLPIVWTNDQLIELLDRRIDLLVRRRYTKQKVTHADLLPKNIDGQRVGRYMVERTFMRPRDIIQFFNYCIRQAVDNPKIGVSMLKHAEGEYSHARLRALADEWRADYPHLDRYIELLRGRKAAVDVEDIGAQQCADLCLELTIDGIDRSDRLAELVEGVADSRIAPEDFRRALIKVFYTIGLIGLKLAGYDPVLWSFAGGRRVEAGEIRAGTRLHIHPVAWRGLAIVFGTKRPGG